MNLYFIHCGFYDEEISEGIYEFHVNIPIAANNLDEAKTKVRTNPTFKKKKMHIDGIQEIKIIDGLNVQLIPTESAQHKTIIHSHLHRDL